MIARNLDWLHAKPLQTTSNSGSYGVSNAYVEVAWPTQISVVVYCFTSSNLTNITDDFFVNVFAGR